MKIYILGISELKRTGMGEFNADDHFISNVGKKEKAMAPTPVLLPGQSHGRRSLVGCSPWGREESDTTEQLHFHFSLSCLGEGDGKSECRHSRNQQTIYYCGQESLRRCGVAIMVNQRV